MPPPSAKVPEQLVIRDFGGLVCNIDRHDQDPGGAQVQVNAVAEKPGELRVRRGYRVLTFDDVPA